MVMVGTGWMIFSPSLVSPEPESETTLCTWEVWKLDLETIPKVRCCFWYLRRLPISLFLNSRHFLRLTIRATLQPELKSRWTAEMLCDMHVRCISYMPGERQGMKLKVFSLCSTYPEGMMERDAITVVCFPFSAEAFLSLLPFCHFSPLLSSSCLCLLQSGGGFGLDWSLPAKQTAVAITAGSETENAQMLVTGWKETSVVIPGFRAKYY